LLLKSDGAVAACGANGDGQCKVPDLRTWGEWLARKSPKVQYVASPLNAQVQSKLVLQACWDGDLIQVVRLSGEPVGEGILDTSQTLLELHRYLTRELHVAADQFDVIFPSGELLSKLLCEQPMAELFCFCT